MAINIIIVGDVVPSDRTRALFEEKKTEILFGDVIPLLKEADYSVVNYESPAVLNQGNPIKKSGPHLSSSVQTMEVLKEAGFNMITLANNHFRDQGEVGVRDTLESARNLGLDYVGGGENLTEARKTRVVSIRGKKFAFLNFCEQEYSIATDRYGGSNPYDVIDMVKAIQEAKNIADYVILIVHGGIEHYPLPTPRMKKEYRFFVDAGADAVVNHHQHCFSGYEFHHGKPICYGLGNFCFDAADLRNNGVWDKGFLAKLSFDEEKVSLTSIPYSQCGAEPKVKLLENSAFEQKFSELNSIIGDDCKLTKAFQDLVVTKQRKLLSVMNVFGNAIFDKLYKKGYLDSLCRQDRLLVIKDLLYCESHLDVLRCSAANLLNDGN